jgi:hypothetical protein
VSESAKPSVKTSASGVFEAHLGVNGAVVRGKKLTTKEAEEYRKKGYNVVVCGTDFRANRARAEAIEKGANGNVVHHGPGVRAGMNALYHFQPDPRGPQGHTFYESIGRSAKT